MKVLLIVDPQADFCLHGSLAVEGSEEVIGVINELLCSDTFNLRIASKDWHPAGHMSFKSWGVHCQQGTPGAEFHRELLVEKIEHTIVKGCDLDVDSYSAFFDNAANKATELPTLLQRIEQERGERIELYLCGLALDYCVAWSALDARKLGYETTLIFDATRAVNVNADDGLEALARMRDAGVKMVDSRSLLLAHKLVAPSPVLPDPAHLPTVERKASQAIDR